MRLGVRLGAGRAAESHSDYREWKALLQAAGAPDGRLHDARHTAATVLLVQGVPERTVMSVMGWSSTAMAARYQHVTDQRRRDVPDRIGGLLWAEQRGTDAAILRLPFETKIETMPGLLRPPEGSASAFPCWEWRRMRDSNPRGLAPNTLSKRAP